MDKKFIIIFVILILIPLALLSYFGFRIIYYQEELEKRRIYSEQKNLVQKIHNSFRQQIITKYRYFYELVNNIKINFSTLKRKSLENRKNGIKIIFFMDTTGQLIFPNYVDFKTSDISFQPYINEFRQIINKAKEFENKGNYRSAIFEYRRIIKQNNNKLPAFYLAQLEYEIALLYFKLKKFQKVIFICEEISSQYSYLLNKDGIPFLFLTSLLMGKSYLKINKPDKTLKVISNLVNSSMNGELILTNTCSILLKETREILKRIKAFEYLISNVDFLIDQVSFGEIFFSKIERALSKYLISHSREVEFLINNPGEPEALSLYFPLERENIKGIIGFEYDLKQIIYGIL
ncbi:hypothetical protein NLC29_03855, partial [Candidatus Aminicenantes bacterium AH-873-B07]|nr:hypothetical protein [Candidatus Aminicenantes bacterium AH-873-B07]